MVDRRWIKEKCKIYLKQYENLEGLIMDKQIIELGNIKLSDATQFDIDLKFDGFIYTGEIKHKGLDKYRFIKSKELNFFKQTVFTQINKWDEMWEKKLKIEQAKERTKEAKQVIESLRNILKFSFRIDNKIDWEKFKDKSSFEKEKPVRKKFNLAKPSKPNFIDIPPEPKKENPKYIPQISVLDKIFSSRKKRKLEELGQIFNGDYNKWVKEKDKIVKRNEKMRKSYENKIIIWKKQRENFIKDLDNKLKIWEKQKTDFYKNQEEINRKVDKIKNEYSEKHPDAIIEYCDMVLSNSQYPDFFPQNFEFDYNPNNKILIVEYSLPSNENIPTLKEVKYIKTKDEFKELYLSDTEFRKLYDDLLYQIVLRSIYELFEADIVNALDSIVFNGWVNSIDKSTGQNVNSCILSIHVKKSEFLEINLSQVDPKACFKILKGIGSSTLYSLTPIAPILSISKADKRFVSSYDVAGNLNDTTNLAAMNWEDFEHLVREIFEKEFTQGGGEVKVTQASRDGGVDAIAFDPDPIRGGKIVIQAKRYTNIVGAAAVRDLYGTVHNEGANKGILITTSDYGSDAYEFAKGKPITLLNGSNLLYLLEKHGHKAKIDIQEARKILAEEKNEK